MATDKRPPWNAPFEEQLEFFRRKLNLPTERWDDIMRSAHDRAFIVAGAQSADLLQDLHGAIETAIRDGTGIDAFRKNFKSTVAKHGWTGWTGQGTEAGEAWRTKVIYQANMASSYAAGRWEQLNDPDLVAAKPYLQYRHRDGVMFPRPQHVSWNGLTLPREHPFWQAHYPPNGWGCHCYAIAVSKAEFMRATAAGKGVAAAPELGDITGIDKGFDYAPGANAKRPYKDFIDQKLINLESPIGSAMWDALRPALREERNTAWREWLADIYDPAKAAAKSQTAIVGAIDLDDLDWLKTKKGIVPKSSEIGIDSGVVNGPKAVRHEVKGDALPREVWENLPNALEEPLAVLYDKKSGKLMYVLQSGTSRTPQLVVEFDFAARGRPHINLIVSAFRPELSDITGRLKGGLLELIRGEIE